MQKFKIAFFGGDSHAGTINDMFQDALPNHPLVESVDFEWASSRWGKSFRPALGQKPLMENIESYDLIFQNSHSLPNEVTPGLIDLLDAKNLWHKVVLYDPVDDSHFHHEEYRKKCLLYCKRAWEPIQFESMARGAFSKDGIPVPIDNMIPLDFPLFQEYLDVVPMDFYYVRDMHITCTLNQAMSGSARQMVVKAVELTDFSDVHSNIMPIHKTLVYTSNYHLSSAATSYRDEMNPPLPKINWWYVYMHLLRRTQILFGAGNHSAVGDHRTWECFASGALVVTDRIPVPNPNNPEPGKHYIKFDLNDIPGTMKIVKELLKDNTEREKIARAGLEHAIMYHSSNARIAYVMSEVVKRLEAK